MPTQPAARRRLVGKDIFLLLVELALYATEEAAGEAQQQAGGERQSH